MHSELMEALVLARNARIEADSIKRSLDETERLILRISSPRMDGAAEKGGSVSYRIERLIDAKNILQANLSELLESVSLAVAKAEKVIEMVRNPKKRAAMRYYYLAGVRTYEKVAALCDVDVRTVKRLFS